MVDERYVFPAAFEGMMRGLAPVVSPAVLREHLQKNGVNYDKLPPAIPLAEYERLLRSVATLVWPHESHEEGLRLTGFHVMEGLIQTSLGSAVAAVLRLIGPKRAMKRLPSMFRTADNFMRVEAQVLSDHEALVTLNFSDGGTHVFLRYF